LSSSYTSRNEYLSIKIPRRLLAALIAHALQDDPNESCGLLLGKGHEADEMHRMSNVNSKPISRYTMQPGELVEAQEKAKNSNREFVAIYHSHTFTQGYPSKTDISLAVAVASISTRHVIISLVEKTRPVVRAFEIGAKSDVTELVIETDGDPYRASD
jgi:proteasome lid subunit RPN8/RPN11|tara:strand:- start:1717 stop:2190 length:474 start_codon:yes stop_codon:yes gene_type:complete